MGEKLGLGSAVSIALGGMIGGGIYAVLGIVVAAAGAAAWLAFLLAGVVALCAGYAYVALNRRVGHPGGAVVFVQEYLDSSTVAGMVGWTLLVGYLGSMAMYAFAFGSYFVDLTGVALSVGLPVLGTVSVARPVASLAVVAGFVALNAVGVRETGFVEDLLVAAKIAVLGVFALVGLRYGWRQGSLTLGFGEIGGTGALTAAAASFVAFQGWQLLFYDQDSMAEPRKTLPRAVYVAIPVAVTIYVAVALVTVALVPELVRRHPETALAVAAGEFLGPLGRGVIGASALVSTASAINATLFSSSLLTQRLVTDDLLPPRIGAPDGGADGEPPVSAVLALGGITGAFAVLGSLQGITAFASLSFIVVFGGACALALRNAGGLDCSRLPPAVGLAGCGLFLPLVFLRLFRHEPATFRTVVVVAVVVVSVELLYFRRPGLYKRVRESLTR
jgi:amino acid transporter